MVFPAFSLVGSPLKSGTLYEEEEEEQGTKSRIELPRGGEGEELVTRLRLNS